LSGISSIMDAGEGAGAPPGSGGVREGAGRPPGTPDSTLAPARIIPTAEKWGFAEKALRHAEDMLDVLVHIAKYGESESARVTGRVRPERRRRCRRLADTPPRI